MAKFKGLDLIIEVKTATTPAVVWTKIAGMTQTGFTINDESVDVTDKDSDGWREMLEGAGIRSMSLTASGYHSTATTSHEFLMDAILNGTFVECRLKRGFGDMFEGVFQLTSTGGSGAHNDAESAEFSFESSGAIDYTAAT